MSRNPSADPNIKATLAKNLRDKVNSLPTENDAMKLWGSFRDALFAFAKFALVHKERKHQDWFENNNAENASLLRQKQETFTNWLHEKTSAARHDRLKHPRNKVQTELRQMKNEWWHQKAAELEQHSDKHNFKRFFDGLKTVYGPSSNAMVPVPSSDGTLLTEKSDIVQRRCKIFNRATSQQTISDRPVSHPRHASAPGSKALLTIPQHRRKPRKMLSNCRLGKHRFLMGYLVKSLRREERSSQSSSLS